MFTIGQAVSTSDNDQVKAAGKNYVNVKPVGPARVYVATRNKQKTQSVEMLLDRFGLSNKFLKQSSNFCGTFKFEYTEGPLGEILRTYWRRPKSILRDVP